MKGFLRRDWVMFWINFRFSLLALIVMYLICWFASRSFSYISTWLIIFPAVALMNLFPYNESKQWEGYAAATPKGRRAMVDARYVLSLCVSAGIMALAFFVGPPGWESFNQALVLGGAFLFFIAIVWPLLYHYGRMKGWLISVCVYIPIWHVVGQLLGALSRTGEIPQFFLPVGLVAILISRPICHAIVGEMEF